MEFTDGKPQAPKSMMGRRGGPVQAAECTGRPQQLEEPELRPSTTGPAGTGLALAGASRQEERPGRGHQNRGAGLAQNRIFFLPGEPCPSPQLSAK